MIGGNYEGLEPDMKEEKSLALSRLGIVLEVTDGEVQAGGEFVVKLRQIVLQLLQCFRVGGCHRVGRPVWYGGPPVEGIADFAKESQYLAKVGKWIE